MAKKVRKMPVMLHGMFSTKPDAEKRMAKVKKEHPTRSVMVGATTNGKYFVKSMA